MVRFACPLMCKILGIPTWAWDFFFIIVFFKIDKDDDLLFWLFKKMFTYMEQIASLVKKSSWWHKQFCFTLMGHWLLMHYHAIKATQFKTGYHVTHDISDHDSSLEEKWHVPSFSNNDGLILGFLHSHTFFILLHKIISFLSVQCILTFIHT